MNDEKPETVEETEHAADRTADAVHDAHEATEHPEPEIKETATETIPEWGQALIHRVEEVAEMAAAPVAEGVPADMPENGEEIDDNPVKPPWHSRPLGSLFGYK